MSINLNMLNDKQVFIEWLRTKRDDEEVGERCNPEACPIATYLSEKWNLIGVRVAFPRAMRGDDFRWSYPLWALEFIKTIDRSVVPSQRRHGVIYGWEAKQAIDRINLS